MDLSFARNSPLGKLRDPFFKILVATHTHIKVYQIQAPLVEGNTDLQKFTKIYKSGEIYGNSVVTDFSKIFNRHR